MTDATIRAETPGDAAAIRAVYVEAFPQPAEADLVERLRDDGDLTISLVADVAGVVVGHIAFSPVARDGERDEPPGLGLAPLAVAEEHRGQGIARQLVEAGLEACRAAAAPFAVVLGESEFYTRFGFERADELGFDNGYGAGAEFRIVALVPHGLTGRRGMITYASAFDDL